MIRLVIFDFDGVLEDNYELHYKLSQKQIKNITRDEHRNMFEGNVHIERDKLKSRDTGFNFIKHFGNARKKIIMKKEIKEVLTKLANVYSLGIVTSAQEKGINEYLNNNKIKDIFSFIYGFETDKIKTRKFIRILNKLDFKIEECVFITDTLGDILEAKKVGIKVIAVDFGFHERERLKKGNPFMIISNFEDLYLLIRNLK